MKPVQIAITRVGESRIDYQTKSQGSEDALDVRYVRTTLYSSIIFDDGRPKQSCLNAQIHLCNVLVRSILPHVVGPILYRLLLECPTLGWPKIASFSAAVICQCETYIWTILSNILKTML